jgi:hypothetical protein
LDMAGLDRTGHGYQWIFGPIILDGLWTWRLDSPISTGRMLSAYTVHALCIIAVGGVRGCRLGLISEINGQISDYFYRPHNQRLVTQFVHGVTLIVCGHMRADVIVSSYRLIHAR